MNAAFLTAAAAVAVSNCVHTINLVDSELTLAASSAAIHMMLWEWRGVKSTTSRSRSAVVG